MPDSINGRQYGPQYKLIGKNYQTADLMAKVTGKVEMARQAFALKACCAAEVAAESPQPHARGQAHRWRARRSRCLE